MRFFDEERAFLTPYPSLVEFALDCSYLFTDPLMSLWDLTKNLTYFFLSSVPMTAALITFNVPLLLLLPFPVAMVTLSLSMAVAVYASLSLFQALFHAVECIISPIINTIRIMSNLAATSVETFSCEGLFNGI